MGHLLHGRVKAIVCNSNRYLMALCRYLERNPAAVGLMAAPSE
jgi:putative transposase